MTPATFFGVSAGPVVLNASDLWAVAGSLIIIPGFYYYPNRSVAGAASVSIY